MGDYGFKINEPFFIVSRLPMKRVAEAIGASNVVIKKYAKGRIAQQWIFDQVTKTVKSVQWKSHSLELQGNNLACRPTTSRWMQMFRYQDSHILNDKMRNKAMDVQGAYDAENRNILMWNRHNGLNQQWDIVYVKDMPEEPKKGELNKDFNFKVDTDFHVVTKMASGRYLDFLGRNLVIKTPNGRRS